MFDNLLAARNQFFESFLATWSSCHQSNCINSISNDPHEGCKKRTNPSWQTSYPQKFCNTRNRFIVTKEVLNITPTISGKKPEHDPGGILRNLILNKFNLVTGLNQGLRSFTNCPFYCWRGFDNSCIFPDCNFHRTKWFFSTGYQFKRICNEFEISNIRG